MAMELRMRRRRSGALAAGLALALATAPAAQDLEVVAALMAAPGNISVSAAGRIFVSLHQLYQPAIAVAELVDGALVPFPNAAWNDRATAGGDRFNAVLGLQVDADERLWRRAGRRG